MGMQSKRHSTIAGAAVLSLLLLGLVPVFAQSNDPTQTDKATTPDEVDQGLQHSERHDERGNDKHHNYHCNKHHNNKHNDNKRNDERLL